jgi:hypothetical protein
MYRRPLSPIDFLSDGDCFNLRIASAIFSGSSGGMVMPPLAEFTSSIDSPSLQSITGLEHAHASNSFSGIVALKISSFRNGIRATSEADK